MIEINGDFWQEVARNSYDAICCTTNGVVTKNGSLVMGAGIAKQFADKYKGLAAEWGGKTQQYFQRYRLVFPHVMISQDFDSGMYLVAFPTKRNWKHKSILALIYRSAESLLEIVNSFGWNKILLPRPGCGCGNLDWHQVKETVSQFMDERFYVIHNGK